MKNIKNQELLILTVQYLLSNLNFVLFSYWNDSDLSYSSCLSQQTTWSEIHASDKLETGHRSAALFDLGEFCSPGH